MNYAVIKSGGKQYKVSSGDVILVEKITGESGSKVTFDDVIMMGEGKTIHIEDSDLKLSYDLYYLKNFSTVLDLIILFRTVKTILKASGR